MRIRIPIGITIVATVAMLAVVACFVPLVTVPYEVTVDYEETETYYEDEPYEETESYTETLPLDYEVVDTDIDVQGQATTVSVTVRNQDSIAGIFTVELYVSYDCTIIAPGSIYVGPKLVFDQQELSLEPHGTRTATLTADSPDPPNCAFEWWSYDVAPSTKEVEKEGTVTKYRQVEKQRTVTRQRQETRYKKVTLLDYLLHYR